MSYPPEPILHVNRAQQVAFVVHDLDQAIERQWRFFGIGPWKIDIRDPRSTRDGEMIRDMRYHRQPGSFGYKMAEAVFGPEGVILEYIQPLSGENIYSDFLRTHGEGMHHIGWHNVHSREEFDRVTSLLEGQGFPCLQSARVYAAQMAYFDTTRALNTILEVTYRDPEKTRPAPYAVYP